MLKSILTLLFFLLVTESTYGQRVIQNPPVVIGVPADTEIDFSFSIPPRARQTSLSWYRIRTAGWVPTEKDLLSRTVIRKTGDITHYKELPPGRYLKRVVIVQGLGRKTIIETRVVAVGKERERKSVTELNNRFKYR